ncbi:CoA transferase [Pullulanibacillus camelliae]|uniref:CoA transferase n=1 Tax=Pullulanibacillus camelliae TaxID=1707096 RepID=A0A8J2YIM9_9BACL|nr:CaiB/BaiF CoA-transferase family protein [Pullulanibacillus camelliae]GGE45630.1 CoA transferase [Pullulanibacillus camelliae]
MKLLEGLTVLDFSQFLAGPSAALRLADLGARVIKIERPKTGDASRQLKLKNLAVDGDSLLFHTINRNKESYAVDLRDPDDLAKVKRLIPHVDVIIENFRPGKMKQFGLDYTSVKKLNPRIVYGTVTGYGTEGPWQDKPGQDLLIQSLTGLAWLNGEADQPPTPFPLSIADMFAGMHLVQGILACLIQRGSASHGGLVEVSLTEALLDFQFEVLTTHLNDGGKQPERSAVNNAHAYLGAPYGIYETKNGYIALAMGSVVELGGLLECPALLNYRDEALWFSKRDEIKRLLVQHLRQKTTEAWLEVLEKGGYWCADVLSWGRLVNHEGFKALDMVQTVSRSQAQSIQTTRCPIRVNGQKLFAPKGAPRVGEDNQAIEQAFHL